jgi:hypothetical protein
MNDQTIFKRIAAISAILSGPLAIGSLAMVTLAVDFDFGLMDDQARLITLGNRAANLMGRGEFLGVFGYYLLFIPVTLYLRHWLMPRNPNLINLFTICGLGFIFIGVPGAILRANVLPEMMRAYTQASGAQQEMLAIIFKVTTDVIFAGLSVLEIIFIGVWWLGIGLILRNEQQLLGIFTIMLGIAALGNVVGKISHIEPLIMLEGIVFLFSPLWALWLGIVIWRRDEKHEQMMEVATAG